DAARAFPRPSESDSAKFAKSTVIQSQSETMPGKKTPPAVGAANPARVIRVVMMPPISTRKITGFLTSLRGSSLSTAPRSAPRISSGSNAAMRGYRFRAISSHPACHHQVFCNRSHRQEREEGEPTDEQDDEDCPGHKRRGGGRE